MKLVQQKTIVDVLPGVIFLSIRLKKVPGIFCGQSNAGAEQFIETHPTPFTVSSRFQFEKVLLQLLYTSPEIFVGKVKCLTKYNEISCFCTLNRVKDFV